MFAFPFFLSCDSSLFLRVAVVTGGLVVRVSTWSPAVFRPVSSSATVLARVDVCRARDGHAGRADFLSGFGVFSFAFLLVFLERVDLHPVIICARAISS